MNRRMSRAALALVAGYVLGFAVAAQAQAPKALAGTWKLNVAKSKFSPGPAPKSMSVTYSVAGDAVKVSVDLAPADGPAQHWEFTGSYDGKEVPVKGNPNADAAVLKMVNDTTGESTMKMGGKVTSVNTRVLSADGKVLTITSKGTTADGKPRLDVQVFER